jgi:hypothetical protein
VSAIRTFVVRGRGAFPLEALCASHAWPASKRDADLMAISWAMVRAPKKPYRIYLNAHRAPDPRVWAKHGWDCGP